MTFRVLSGEMQRPSPTVQREPQPIRNLDLSILCLFGSFVLKGYIMEEQPCAISSHHFPTIVKKSFISQYYYIQLHVIFFPHWNGLQFLPTACFSAYMCACYPNQLIASVLLHNPG